MAQLIQHTQVQYKLGIAKKKYINVVLNKLRVKR